MADVNELINGYLRVTGRPPATLSVEEYLQFVRIGNNATIMGSFDNVTGNDVLPVKTKNNQNSGIVTHKSEANVNLNRTENNDSSSNNKKQNDSILKLMQSFAG